MGQARKPLAKNAGKKTTMLSSFLIAINAVMPFMVYLGFGYLTRRIGLVDEPFLNKLNTVVFKCFFPFLMFWNLYNVDTVFHVRGRFIALCVGSLVLLWVLLGLTVPRIVKAKDKQSVIIQAIYRSNFVLFGIPMAESVFGPTGAATATVLVAIVVPLYNASNPLILGALVGLAFLLLGIHLPASLEKPVSEFSGLTTPLALFVLGGTLHFSAIRTNRRYLWPVIAIKLVALPLAVTFLAGFFGFTNVERFVFLIMSGAPVAVSSFTMAANMGGDGELAGQYVFLSTLVSLGTLFAFIFVYHSIGFIA